MPPIITEEQLKRFWLIIDSVPQDIKTEEEQDYQLYTDFLYRVLSRGQKDDLIHFNRVITVLKDKLLQSSVDWDTLTYGLSDDALDYFWYWLISRGSQVYNNCFTDIEVVKAAINQVVNTEYEGISYVANQIWEKKFASEPMPR
jgi:hypothetical protein